MKKQPRPDFIGFVFYPRSPRFVSVSHAKTLASHLPPSIKKVGVIVDSTDDVISHITDNVPLDYLQCHGYETTERIAHLKHTFPPRVIKAIRVRTPDDIKASKAFEGMADMFLFDAYGGPHAFGGTGKTIEWTWLRALRTATPWFLSGGLTPQTIKRAINESGATYVDVSSGVEKSAGVKDHQAMRQFIRHAHDVDILT
ncbi:MAG: phosphoribosylanthranilate isomerase [Alphaproteobacteria bacterium GM7ARS4]|nr:phosphoribosylanthranilate isomerase [Alphaproteobacteria bacterium GM7ARS4]